MASPEWDARQNPPLRVVSTGIPVIFGRDRIPRTDRPTLRSVTRVYRSGLAAVTMAIPRKELDHERPPTQRSLRSDRLPGR